MQKAANESRPFFCCIWICSILGTGAPVGVGTIANGDEARNKDGGSGSECYECEVHSVSPLARATGQAGIAALYYNVWYQ